MLANLLILLAPLTHAIADSFNYTNGGKDWGGTCKTGSKQSPINLKYSRAVLPAPGLGYISTEFTNTTFNGNFSDRGLGIYGNFGNITFEEYGEVFESNIKKIYFFVPAQHYLNGRKYSMEMTILMSSAPGDYYGYALSVLFKTGLSSPFLDNFRIYSDQKGNPIVNLSSILPPTIENFYVYDGSLPVPPCNETVRWFIYPTIQSLSSSQLSFFNDHWAGNKTFAGGRGNTRYTQYLNGRTILYHRTI